MNFRYLIMNITQLIILLTQLHFPKKKLTNYRISFVFTRKNKKKIMFLKQRVK